jgi:hypothetical protein
MNTTAMIAIDQLSSRFIFSLRVLLRLQRALERKEHSVLDAPISTLSLILFPLLIDPYLYGYSPSLSSVSPTSTLTRTPVSLGRIKIL